MLGSHLGQDIDDPEVLFPSVSTAWLMGIRYSIVTMARLLAGLSKHNFNPIRGNGFSSFFAMPRP